MASNSLTIFSAFRAAVQKQTGLAPVAGRGWWPRVLESFSGAWQQNVVVDRRTVSENWAFFACVTLIAGDIAKMPVRVMQFDRAMQIWQKTMSRPVLRQPNRYQTDDEFFTMLVFSLLLSGNAYALIERDERRFVSRLYILDPNRVTPLIAANGDIYYQLGDDNLSGLETGTTVPASEIIHCRINTLWHPLVGLSPIYACGVAAMQGSAIQDNSAKFFANMSRPSGVLTAPGSISDETAARVKTLWEEKFTGANAGKVAVLGDGLKYEQMTMSAVDAQMIEQLKFTGEMICACFHVPPYKLGLGQMPTVNNVAALNQQYYDQALHPIINKIERRFDVGLELRDPDEQCWFDTSELLRLDPATRYESHTKKVAGGWYMPNEARRDEDLPPVVGGETPYLQQQNYSLAALAKRDAKEDPFGTAKTEPASSSDNAASTEDDVEQAFSDALMRVAPLTNRKAA